MAAQQCFSQTEVVGGLVMLAPVAGCESDQRFQATAEARPGPGGQSRRESTTTMGRVCVKTGSGESANHASGADAAKASVPTQWALGVTRWLLNWSRTCDLGCRASWMAQPVVASGTRPGRKTLAKKASAGGGSLTSVAGLLEPGVDIARIRASVGHPLRAPPWEVVPSARWPVGVVWAMAVDGTSRGRY